MSRKPLGERVRRALLRAKVRHRARHQRRSTGRVLTGVVCMVAALMITVSAINARGADLRPTRNTDLIGLIQSESERNGELAAQVTQLRAEVDRLASEQGEESSLQDELDEMSAAAGMKPVTGRALTVTLDDAPTDVAPDGIDGDLLVVHQQDIQAVVNLLWAGGATAMTIQGQRVISTTGIKCVGNTVVLHGIPYAPPYRISAIGDIDRMRATLDNSDFVRVYQQYVDRFRLGYRVQVQDNQRFEAYSGSLDLHYASVPTR